MVYVRVQVAMMGDVRARGNEVLSDCMCIYRVPLRLA